VDDPLDVRHLEAPGGVVRLLTLHRPAARNAMDTAMLVALVEALDEADRDPTTRGLVVTGAGGVFSAGADVREPLVDGGRRRMELFTAVYEALTLFRVPTAAAVQGPAVGGGAEVAAACDLRVAAPDAFFRFPGAIHGVPVGTARTIGQVGLSVAKDWVLSSRDVAAEEAERRGFVQQVSSDPPPLEVALGWVRRTAERDHDTVQLLKRLFVDRSGLRDRVAFENDALRAQAETGPIGPTLERDLPGTVRPRRT
jgi:enoyl-CoA hydratase